MTECVQWSPVCGWKDFCLWRVSNPGPLDHQVSANTIMLHRDGILGAGLFITSTCSL